MFESVSARGLWAAFTQLQEKRYTECLADAASCKSVCSATLLGGFRVVPGGDREYQGSTPQAAKPSSHLDTKSPHSWSKGVSPDHASTAKEQETLKGRGNHSTHPLPFSCHSSLLLAVMALPPRSSSLYTQWCTRALWSGRCCQNGSNNSNPPSAQPTLKDSVKQSPLQP